MWEREPEFLNVGPVPYSQAALATVNICLQMWRTCYIFQLSLLMGNMPFLLFLWIGQFPFTLLPPYIMFCSRCHTQRRIGRAPAHQSFLGYDNDKDLKVCFLVIRVILPKVPTMLTYNSQHIKCVKLKASTLDGMHQPLHSQENVVIKTRIT